MVAEFSVLLVSAYVDMTVDDRAVACLELMLDAPKKMANAIMRERVKGGKERDARQE